ncbi:MAG: hypothetical protein SFU98_01335 [Leptospiraceae bacterium]|nr:hypothetical protein [Leptospiraceae bacterium]
MKYIRSCPNCSKLVRFPLDKGTLLVRCPYCQNSFSVDPDDPSLYNSGRFDLSNTTKTFETTVAHNSNFLQRIGTSLRSSIQNQPIIKWIILFLFILLLALHSWKLMKEPAEVQPPKLSPPTEELEGDDSGIDV